MNIRVKPLLWAVGAGALLLLVSSCKKDLYDEDKLARVTRLLLPVDQIDAGHTWALTTDHTVSVDASQIAVGAERLQIWDADAASGKDAHILAETFIQDGGHADMVFTAPLGVSRFYAAIVDKQGVYTVQAFDAFDGQLSFTKEKSRRIAIYSGLLTRQTLVYCFEDYSEFLALTSDFDYNDVVLAVSQHQTGERQIRLDVTLSAVGSFNQMGAALRLSGYGFDDIERVTTADGKTFDDGLVKNSSSLIEHSELLIRGMNGEAVINLFEDAHWATGKCRVDRSGFMVRQRFNVSKRTDAYHRIERARTISYLIDFKDGASLSSFRMSMLDPFVVLVNAGGNFELHASRDFFDTCVLKTYAFSKNVACLPWGLAVPSSSFRYPLEGKHIGFLKDGVHSGAYMADGHSFAEWVADHTVATDWYDHPTDDEVY